MGLMVTSYQQLDRMVPVAELKFGALPLVPAQREPLPAVRPDQDH